MIPVLDRALHALSPLLDDMRNEGRESRIRVDLGPDYAPFVEQARGLLAHLRRSPQNALRLVAVLVACRERLEQLERERDSARADERSRVLAEVADLLQQAFDRQEFLARLEDREQHRAPRCAYEVGLICCRLREGHAGKHLPVLEDVDEARRRVVDLLDLGDRQNRLNTEAIAELPPWAIKEFDAGPVLEALAEWSEAADKVALAFGFTRVKPAAPGGDA